MTGVVIFVSYTEFLYSYLFKYKVYTWGFCLDVTIIFSYKAVIILGGDIKYIKHCHSFNYVNTAIHSKQEICVVTKHLAQQPRNL